MGKPLQICRLMPTTFLKNDPTEDVFYVDLKILFQTCSLWITREQLLISSVFILNFQQVCMKIMGISKLT